MYYYLNTRNSVFAAYVFAVITSRIVFVGFYFAVITSLFLFRGFYFAVIALAVIVFTIITGYEIQHCAMRGKASLLPPRVDFTPRKSNKHCM
jgi:hypothetical protein